MKKKASKYTYDSLLEELNSIPEKDTLESPLLDFILDTIVEAKGPKIVSPGSVVITALCKRLNHTTDIIVDSYLTSKENSRMTGILIWAINAFVEEEERIMMNIDLFEALLKSWKSLGTPEYNERVIKFLSVSPNGEATPEDLMWMFETLKKPLDFESTKRRRITEIMEENEYNIKMFGHGTSDDIMLSNLGNAIDREEKERIIRGIKKRMEEELEERDQ